MSDSIFLNKTDNTIIIGDKPCGADEFNYIEISKDSEEYTAIIAEQKAEIQAKKNITKRQLLIWLYTNKQKTEDDIYAAINSIPNASQKYLAKVNYSGTNNFYYGNAFVPVIGGALGLTTSDLTKMFDEAVSL